MYEISSTGWKLSSFSMARVVEHDLFPLFFVHLKQNTFEMTNGGERPASTPLHVNGLANKTREEKQSPDRYELKESESGSKPQSNAQGVQNDKTAERAWWINSFFPCFNRHISIQSCVHFYCSRLQLKAEFEIFYLAYFLFCLFFFCLTCHDLFSTLAECALLPAAFVGHSCSFCCTSGLRTPVASLSCLLHTGQNKSSSVSPYFSNIQYDLGLVLYNPFLIFSFGHKGPGAISLSTNKAMYIQKV